MSLMHLDTLPEKDMNIRFKKDLLFPAGDPFIFTIWLSARLTPPA